MSDAAGRTDSVPGEGPDGSVATLLDEVLEQARAASRADLVTRLAAARARVSRPATVVVVVGEFKQGKSSLVNALVDHDACPVDDDLATSVVTVVHHAPEPTAVERRMTDDGPVVEQVPLAEVRDHVTEDGNPDNQRAIERLDLGVPAPLLADGVVLVDTPGMGGLGAGHAASTLGFLPFADALLFVTDASQELTAPEIRLLARARRECPLVLTVLTKVDLHPEWRTILELDRGHLAAAGVPADILPVSATVHTVARDRGDDGLDVESGVPALEDRLRRDVVGHARARATVRAAAEVEAVCDQLHAAAQAELAALQDGERARALADQVTEARARLDHLRGPGARWSTVLGDRITDLSQRASHELRRAVRRLSRELDEEFAELGTDEDWQRMARTVQQRTAEVVADLFDMVEEGSAELRDDLLALLGDEGVVLPGGDVVVEFDTAALWSATDETDPDVAGGALARLRGSQSGMAVAGVMGRLLPAAATGLLASNPILLGAGVLLGGKALVDQRRRQLTERRHQARQALRQFLDDVQFELGPILADAVRELQRELRDGVRAAVEELQRTWTEAGRRASAALAASDAEREERVPRLEAQLTDLERLRATARRLQETPHDGGPA